MEFKSFTKDEDRKAFVAKLPKSQWWLGGKRKGPDFGWQQVFEASDGKCIYCDRDLATSTDALAESTEEHLVPRSLLRAAGCHADSEHNMATCCAGCNGLKFDAVPPTDHPCWKNRKAYIKECTRYVAKRRLENFRRYKDRVEKVLARRAGE